MAPPFKQKTALVVKPRNLQKWDINTAWWQQAYNGHPDIVATFEFDFNGDHIRPGNLLKIKHDRSTFAFRCIAYNKRLETTWIDCVDVESGEWRSFPLEKVKGLIKPKKSRRRKKNA